MFKYLCCYSSHLQYVVCDLAAAPHLTEKPQDVQKTIDDTLVWECKASAKPKPSYRWLKNGEALDQMEVRDFSISVFFYCFKWQKQNRTKNIIISQEHPPFNTLILFHRVIRYWLCFQTKTSSSNHGCTNHLLSFTPGFRFNFTAIFSLRCSHDFSSFSSTSNPKTHYVSHPDK